MEEKGVLSITNRVETVYLAACTATVSFRPKKSHT